MKLKNKFFSFLLLSLSVINLKTLDLGHNLAFVLQALIRILSENIQFNDIENLSSSENQFTLRLLNIR